METSLYIVNPGKTIFHKGICYQEGQKVELTIDHALVHGTNIKPFKDLDIGTQGLMLTQSETPVSKSLLMESSDD